MAWALGGAPRVQTKGTEAPQGPSMGRAGPLGTGESGGRLSRVGFTGWWGSLGNTGKNGALIRKLRPCKRGVAPGKNLAGNGSNLDP